METTHKKSITEDQKMQDKADNEMTKGLRLLFRNKYAQTEPAAIAGLYPMVPDHSGA